MFLAILEHKTTGETVYNLYTDYLDHKIFVADHPNFKTTRIFNFGLHGATYAERKSALYDLAVDYSLLLPDAGGLSYGEIAEINNYFETNGKRYGLIKELRENGLI